MSAADPWMKFFPQDWRSDEKLRLCSLAARGLWIEMLAIMHRSERYGHLLISGRVPTDAQLAVQAGASPDEVTALLRELEDADVYSRTASGAIYSRRMTRDHRRSQNAKKNGKKGGNPSLSNKRENSGSVNLPDKGSDKPICQKPEARREANASPQAGARETDLPRLMADCCRAAGIEVPDPSRNFDRHTAALDVVQGWIEAGADPDMIQQTLTQRSANLRTSPRSLAFFDKPVRQAAEDRNAAATRVSNETGALIDRILKRDAA